MNRSSIKARYWIAALSLALLMAGPFVASALYAWGVSTEEHRAIFSHYFQQVFPLGLALTALATVLGFVVLNRLFRDYVKGMVTTAERLTVMLTSNRDLRWTNRGRRNCLR